MNQFRNKKQIIKRKIIARNIIGFGIFFILCILGFLSWSGRLFNYIGHPIWKTEKLINDSFYNFNYFFKTKASISKENHSLIEENLNIKLKMIDYEILKKDNEKLKELLGRLPENSNFILGNILSKPNHSPYDTIIVDIGRDVGIVEGVFVYANGSIPIGQISKVYDKTSLIVLFTSPGQKTEGFIEGTNASVELIGRGGGNFEMIVPVELLTEDKMAVHLPGNSSFVIGLIDEIISSPTDPVKKVLLSSPVNVQNLKWVEVKKN